MNNLNYNKSKKNFDSPILGESSIKNIKLILFIYILKIFVIGGLVYLCYKYTGIQDEQNRTISSYILFLFSGSIILFGIAFSNFIIECNQSNNVQLTEMNYKDFALSSMFGPIIIIAYIIIIIVSKYIGKLPGIGMIIKTFFLSKIGIILSIGILYIISFSSAYSLTKCKN